MKTCNICNKKKPLTEFYKRKDSKDGFNHKCKQCVNTQNNQHRAQHKDEINLKNRLKYKTDPSIRAKKLACQSTEKYKEKRRARVLDPIARIRKREADKSYDRRNPDKKRAKKVKRRAAELNRTVPWANLKLIAKFYKLAQELTLQTGIMHHVDHIIPLQGKYVSGLHVETNLQVITAKENLHKSNSSEYGIIGLCPAGDYI